MLSLAMKAISVFTIMASTAAAATVTISDLLDGNPIVTTSADLIGVTTVLTLERAVITGTLPAGITVQPGIRSVILLEPPSDPFGPRLSDFVTLVIGATAPTVSITFESDGAVNFDNNVAQLPPGTPQILEDGTFQDVSALLNSGALQISIQSDLASPEIPEPSSGFLMLSGVLLTGAGLIRRRKTVAVRGT